MSSKKKVYKDPPRYTVIYQYENDFRKSWSSILQLAIAEFKIELTRKITEKN